MNGPGFAFDTHDHVRMARALTLAARVDNGCDPNPRVGCVIDADGEIVGEGWHTRAGEPHAEIHALAAAGERSRGGTAYVTLEPCCHQGRTGPCSEALAAAGIRRVVVAAGDPNPSVDGGGVSALRQAGIEVETGLMAEASASLNRGFFSRMRQGRPFVVTKIAASLDGRVALADGTSQWITSEASRADVQRMRARSSAILTGIGTVLADNPRMTVRLEESSRWQQPLRVVVDSRLRTPPAANVVNGPGTVLVVGASGADPQRADALRAAGAQVVQVKAANGRIDLGAVLELLAEREVNEVMVEAGPALNGALLQAGLLDEIVIYQAPHLLGGDAMPMFELPPLAAMTGRPVMQPVASRRIGNDWRLRLVPGSV